MQLFHTQNNHLTPLSETPFTLENDIQTLCEQNLSKISDLIFVKSEFTIKNRRIDTLAYDPENQSFVIIEYKRNKNYSVVDQGVSYLNLMLEYKAEFIIEYNESRQENLKREDVDWSQSKIIFVAPSFTDDQKQSTNFKDFAIELWEIKRFNDIVMINPIAKSKSAPSIKQIKLQEIDNSNELANIIKEVRTYDEDYHLENKPDNIKELYQEFKTAILNLADDIEVNANKVYIAFRKNKNLVCVIAQKSQLKLIINVADGQLDDPKKLANYVGEIGHWGTGDYRLEIKDNTNKEYIMSLIKQAI